MLGRLKRSLHFRVVCAVFVALSLIFAFAPQASATVKSDYKSYVMGPLTDVTDFTAFGKQLTALKNAGVTGITSDVWWGEFEGSADQTFTWTYYKTFANAIRSAGLKWSPILSFHQCGGNVGDTCNIPIPSWLFNGSYGTNDQLEFKDESGFQDKEYLSFWAGTDVNQYDQALQSFASNFSTYTDIIDSINLGLGPAGELRYPSYNAAAGWSYPSRGKLQAYSGPAKTDFQSAMQSKYGTLSALNSAWGTSLTAWTQISPPTDGDNFFINGYASNYGKDFLTWYQSVLTRHMSQVMTKAHTDLDNTFHVRVASKVAGIHWLYYSPSMPHAAEYGAGYYNYSTLEDQFVTSNADLDFTCLEMTDSQANTSPYYSAPKTLVIQVANLAKSKGVRIMGENALAIAGNTSAYDNVAEMLFNYNFAGFALLRISNLVDNNGNAVVNSGVNELTTFSDRIALKPVAITFTINGVTTTGTQSVYVVGDRREIGMWDPYVYASPMTKTGTNTWTTTVYLGASRSYQFKMIKRDSSNTVTWENGSNKSYTAPASGTGSNTSNWQN